ncbi:hypothetical protein [Pantoea agglomerans]
MNPHRHAVGAFLVDDIYFQEWVDLPLNQEHCLTGYGKFRVTTRRRFSQITGIYSMLETLVAVNDSEVTKINLR